MMLLIKRADRFERNKFYATKVDKEDTSILRSQLLNDSTVPNLIRFVTRCSLSSSADRCITCPLTPRGFAVYFFTSSQKHNWSWVQDDQTKHLIRRRWIRRKASPFRAEETLFSCPPFFISNKKRISWTANGQNFSNDRHRLTKALKSRSVESPNQPFHFG
jgi:hypothetical protein